MEKLVIWFQTPPTTPIEYLAFFFGVLLTDLTWSFLLLPRILKPFRRGLQWRRDTNSQHYSKVHWTLIVLRNATIEEVVFRLPLSWSRVFSLLLVQKIPQEMSMVIEFVPIIVFLLAFSFMFGLAHGGPINLIIQGFGGFLYGLMFIKFGGTSLVPVDIGIAFLSVCLAHFFFNMIGDVKSSIKEKKTPVQNLSHPIP